jgi:predicted phosphodiesterase
MKALRLASAFRKDLKRVGRRAIADLDLDPIVGFAAVVHGHSHKPSIETRDGVLYINPGSAGPKRFRLPVTVGRLHVTDDGPSPEIVELDV